MQIDLANAPVSWGVDYADAPGNPDWRRVMTEISNAGYKFTELGPVGYFPEDTAQLSRELAAHGLTLTAGFLFQPLHDPEAIAEVLDAARRVIAVLSATGADRLVLIDHISAERIATAGDPDRRIALGPARRSHMFGMVDRLADMALDAGIRPVLHQHAGCYLEFEDEIEDVLSAIESDRLGLCLDTGHLSYAGIDAIAFHRRHANRVAHLHFKEIAPDVLDTALRDRIGFLPAVERGVFCPLGRGTFDWPSYVALLRETDYRGSATVEQDVEPGAAVDPLRDARESLSFLASHGLPA